VLPPAHSNFLPTRRLPEARLAAGRAPLRGAARRPRPPGEGAGRAPGAGRAAGLQLPGLHAGLKSRLKDPSHTASAPRPLHQDEMEALPGAPAAGPPAARPLIFFRDASQHVARLARVLRQPRGNALLVGVGGSGKASTARFAARVAGLEVHVIEPRRGFGLAGFREDVKRAYKVGSGAARCFRAFGRWLAVLLAAAGAACCSSGQACPWPLHPCPAGRRRRGAPAGAGAVGRRAGAARRRGCDPRGRQHAAQHWRHHR
jgi:hypothetical protein